MLVADRPIPEGTPAEELDLLVRTELLPEKAALDGRVTDLAQLAGQVAAVDLLPGEQLLTDRFELPDEGDAPGVVAVPAGLQEVSVLLEPQRAVGGRLAAGDTVGVMVSMIYQGGTVKTHAVLHEVLVTQVQGAPSPVDADGAEGAAETASSGGAAPTQSLMITLAVTAPQAEAVVFGMEHGTVWLTLEPEDADTSGTDVLDQITIYTKDLA